MAIAILFIIYCLEAGAFFAIVPWTRFWTFHPLLHANPTISILADNFWIRGLVTGFGLAHFIAAVREAVALVERYRSRTRQ
jgi:hypothetical protein